MLTIDTVTHHSANEDSQEELSIELKRGFWRTLFNQPKPKLTFIKIGSAWLHKDSFEYPSSEEDAVIFMALWTLDTN